MINAIESSTEIERNEKSRVSGVGGRKKVVVSIRRVIEEAL